MKSGVSITATLRTCVVTCLAVLAASAPAYADRIDRYMLEQLRTLHIPGASIAIVRDGRIVKAAGYGFADLQSHAAAKPDTVYEIGSNTKQFTAAAVMLLVQDGRLSLDDRVTKYFPDAPPAWAPITIRHLLSHTSGIQNHVGVPGFLDAFRTNLSGQTTPAGDELLKRFFGLPLEFTPGETWAYDNTGYYLLGLIVEKASRQPYFDFLAARIFRPLGMTATRSSDPRPIIPNRAAGYEWLKGSFENRPVLLPAIAFSAGSLVSTVEDLAKWDAALYRENPLSEESRTAMWTPPRLNEGSAPPVSYGLGWFIGTRNGSRVVQHSGGTPGFSSAIYRFLDDRVTIIVLTNHTDRLVDQMALDIAGMYLPKLKSPIGESDPQTETSRRLRDVFAHLLDGRIDDAMFTPAMTTFLHTTTGKGLWQWFASHGGLGSFTYSAWERQGASRILHYRVGLGDGSYWFSVRVEADERISQIVWW